MRILAACSAVFLGLSALLAMSACSDVSDGSAGAGGASGAAPTASGGKAAAGASSGGGSAGSGTTCLFLSSACTGCLQSKCGMQTGACVADDACSSELATLSSCACGGKMTPDECQAAFQTAGGSVAEELGNCYSLNCTEVCE